MRQRRERLLRPAIRTVIVALALSTACLAGTTTPHRALVEGTGTSQIEIPRVDRPPRLEEFLSMHVGAESSRKLTVVTGFIQRSPDDGRPATQSTEAYLGYDAHALYIIFVAHDTDPSQIRGRLDHRESIAGDEDQVGIYIDTFNDRRRAYQFECNPLGVQDDSMYSEDSDSADAGFDTVWHSEGKITPNGYVVLMRIPFKSLRFSHEALQTWDIALWRYLGRRSEDSWWPRVSSNHRGILSQAATSRGIENISPARNFQINPYISWRSFYSVDARDPNNPVYTGRAAQVAAGADGKVILKDSLVLDLTVKPDFSQVESDQPQITTNQRYEVFYPENRPFFTENSSYFDAPMVTSTQHLVFTRRIVDPDFGARLSGKIGHSSMGALFADDRSPGETVPVSDPMSGKRAYFEVLRLSHDLPGHDNVGVTYAGREFAGAYSRVVDLDTTFNIGHTWKGTLIGAYNWNRGLDDKNYAGTTVDATLTRVSRNFNYIGYFLNRTPDFAPAMSFYGHSNWREFGQTLMYQWWPQDSPFTRIWAQVYAARNCHYNGVLNWEGVSPYIGLEIKHNTAVHAYVTEQHDVFSHQDFPQLNYVTRFPIVPAYGLTVLSSQLRFLTFNINTEWGKRSNVTPPVGEPPVQAQYRSVNASVSFLTSRGLTIANTYLFDHNADLRAGRSMYDSHTVRSAWNWQFNRELSLRLIAQYSAVLANPAFTSTATARGFNADFLLTYFVHPGTAFYLGYNSNLSKPGIVPPVDPQRFVNDGRQVFAKIEYLFRF